jgi:hypothetical protein
MRNGPGFWVSLVVVVLAAGMAHAQTGDAVAAEALFRRAREAKAAGDNRTACPLFAESQRLDPSVGTLMNLADCEEHEGSFARAWEHWHEALDALLRDGDARAGVARAHVAALDRRIPKLTLRVPAGIDGARVTRDDVELGAVSLGIPIPVDPGPHRVTLVVPGRQATTKTVTLAEGQSLEVMLEAGAELPLPTASAPSVIAEPPAPLAARPSTTATAARPSTTATRVVATASFAAAGAGLVLDVVSGAIVVHEKSVVSDDCHTPSTCTGPGVSAASAGKTWDIVNAVASAFTVAAAATGVTLWIASHNKTTVVPSLAPHQASLTLTRTF